MKKKLVSLLIMAVKTLSIFSFTACSDDSGSGSGAVEKAEEGEITVYTALEDEQVSEYLEAFNKEYPDITVNVVRESTGIITARLLAEKDNPQADVVWGTAASSMMVLDDQGGLKGYAPEGVDRILPEFKSDKEEPTWVGIDAWETAFTVNTEEAEKLGLPEITSYEDLLDPAFKGHIVMSNPNSSGTGFLTVSAILQLMGEEEGWDYLDKLDENISSIHTQDQSLQKWRLRESAPWV